MSGKHKTKTHTLVGHGYFACGARGGSYAANAPPTCHNCLRIIAAYERKAVQAGRNPNAPPSDAATATGMYDLYDTVD